MKHGFEYPRVMILAGVVVVATFGAIVIAAVVFLNCLLWDCRHE